MDDRGTARGGMEIRREFVVSYGDASPAFDGTEEVFDTVPTPVNP